MKEPEYIVSVRLMTYNHAPFIRQAMEGILMQKTTFNVEVVVGDDFSTDGTLDIIREYKSTDNIHIRILERRVGDAYWKARQERGRLYNFVNTLQSCSGKYIALLDGDDYWTDSSKLQKQVELLDNYPEYAICFHNALLVNENGQNQIFNNFSGNRAFVIEDLAKKNFVSTASCMYRNIGHLPDWFMTLPAGDWGLNIINAATGNIYFIDKCMSIYRIHKKSIWSGQSNRERIYNGAKTLEIINRNMNYKYDAIIRQAMKDRIDSYQSKSMENNSLAEKLKNKALGIIKKLNGLLH